MKNLLKFLVVALLFFPSFAFANYSLSTSDTQTSLINQAPVGTTAGKTYIMQSFVPAVDVSIQNIAVCFLKLNAPTDNVVLQIYNDTGGFPNAVVDTGSTIAATTITLSATDYTLTGFQGTTLTANSRYWVVLTRSGALDSTNRVITCGQNTPTTAYPLYTGSALSSSTLQLATARFVFNFASSGSGTAASVVSLSLGTSTVFTVDNSGFNLWAGMVFFMVSFWGLIWFFRRSR